MKTTRAYETDIALPGKDFAALSTGLAATAETSYNAKKLSPALPAKDFGHSAAKGCASSYDTYCGGKRHMFTKAVWVHIGGTDTDEHPSNRSSTHKPGHITKGNTHMCKQIGALPPTGTSSSRLCGVVQRGNTEEHIMPIYAEKQDLYIASSVRPTFRAYKAGKPAT